MKTGPEPAKTLMLVPLFKVIRFTLIVVVPELLKINWPMDGVAVPVAESHPEPPKTAISVVAEGAPEVSQLPGVDQSPVVTFQVFLVCA